MSAVGPKVILHGGGTIMDEHRPQVLAAGEIHEVIFGTVHQINGRMGHP